MLRPLYDYAMRYQLLPPPGMVKKTVKAWVCLGANGTFLGVRQDGKEEYFCPDIGSLANGKVQCAGRKIRGCFLERYAGKQS